MTAVTRFNVTVGLILLGRLALTVYYSVLTELPDLNSWIVGDKTTASNPKNSGQSSVIIKHVFTIITVNSRGSIKCIPLHLHRLCLDLWNGSIQFGQTNHFFAFLYVTLIRT